MFLSLTSNKNRYLSTRSISYVTVRYPVTSTISISILHSCLFCKNIFKSFFDLIWYREKINIL